MVSPPVDPTPVQADPEKERRYEEAQAEARADFQDYAHQYYGGEITLDEFNQKMRDRLKRYYLVLAVLASDGSFSLENQADKEDLQLFLGGTYELLDDFNEKIVSNPDISENALVWQAGIYSFARGGYTRYTVDQRIFHALPVFPGVDCLGDGACGCSLQVEEVEDGVYVHWLVDFFKENCVVCLSAAAESPFFFFYDEL